MVISFETLSFHFKLYKIHILRIMGTRLLTIKGVKNMHGEKPRRTPVECVCVYTVYMYMRVCTNMYIKYGDRNVDKHMSIYLHNAHTFTHTHF